MLLLLVPVLRVSTVCIKLYIYAYVISSFITTAMWGIHDRQLLLRRALYDTLTKKYYRQALYRRWRLQQTQANKQVQSLYIILSG
jgi:hypothetical protein